MPIEDPNSEQNKSFENNHSTTENTPVKTPTEVTGAPNSNARNPHHPRNVKKSNLPKASFPLLGYVEIISGTIIVSVLLWIAVILLWYTAGGTIKFLGLLVTSIISLFGLIGVLWAIFLKNVWKFLGDRHHNRGRFFYKTVLITNVVALFLCGGILIWGFDPYTHQGWLTLSSSLSNSSDNYWHEQQYGENIGKCQFIDGTYHVKDMFPRSAMTCIATATDYTDFIYEVHMRIINNGDCGGLVFRADRANNKHYVFYICKDHTYCLYRNIPPQNPQDIVGCHGEVDNLSSILKGIDINTASISLAIEALGEKFVLWVNSQELDVGFDLSNEELKEGEIGVSAVSLQHITEVAFSNAKVWVFNGS